MDDDCDDELGRATILPHVMEEADGIALTAGDNYDGITDVLYQAKFPWQITDTERGLTEDKLTEMFNRYVGILTDEAVPVEEQSVENGG